MLPMEILDGIPVITPKGRFDAFQVDDIDETMESIFSDKTIPKVVVSLVQVNFIGSPAIEALTVWLAKAREQGGDVKLASLRQTMRMRLKIESLANFTIYDDTAEAIAAFKSDATANGDDSNS